MPDQLLPELSADRLRQLLAAGTETDHLDYKATIDLAERRDVVELVKDVGAFLAVGGDIVVGASDDGSGCEDFTDELAAKFDPSKVDQKFSRYIDKPFAVQVARHEIDGRHYVLLHIEPSPDGICVFKAPGTYPDPSDSSRQRTAFSIGDVFVREGAQSIRWQQHHVRALLQRIVSAQREGWLRTHRAELEEVVRGATAQTLAAGPARSLSWTLDAETFEETLIELLREEDSIPVRLFVEGIGREGKHRLISDDADALDDFRTILDRVAILASIGVRLHHADLIDQALSIFLGLYDSLHTAEARSLPVRPEQLWLDIIARVYGVGGVAVRSRNWPAVRLLVLQKTFVERRGRRLYWFRHSVTHGSRAHLVRTKGTDGPTLPEIALENARRAEYLKPDLSPDDEALFDSLLQFDLLACAVVIHETGDEQMEHWIPEFAYWYSHRVEPAVALLVSDEKARAALVPTHDPGIAHLARVLHAGAKRLAGFGYSWDGWGTPGVSQFLKAHPEPTP